MNAKTHIAEQYVAPLLPYLKREDVTELCINRPKEVLLETRAGWETHSDESLTFSRLEGILKAVANQSRQQVGETSPILSATLPTGERLQVVMPPAVRQGHISLTIRKPAGVAFTLADYVEQGAFSETRHIGNSLLPDRDRKKVADGIAESDKTLLELIEKKDYEQFLTHAVNSHKNIVVSGSTGSGKTTLMKALIDKVNREERLLSIENVDELTLDATFPNSVPLFYSAGGSGRTAITQRQLMESALRMKPDRIFVAELIRGNEAFDFLQSINSGHPGSITSLHANTARLAFARLAILLKQSDTGAGLDYDVLRSMLAMTIDIVVQVNRVGPARKITELFYDPVATLWTLES